MSSADKMQAPDKRTTAEVDLSAGNLIGFSNSNRALGDGLSNSPNCCMC